MERKYILIRVAVLLLAVAFFWPKVTYRADDGFTAEMRGNSSYENMACTCIGLTVRQDNCKSCTQYADCYGIPVSCGYGCYSKLNGAWTAVYCGNGSAINLSNNESNGSVANPQFGVPAAPSVTCSINAEVLGVEKKRTNFPESALSAGRADFDYYLINVEISNISTFDSLGGGSCDDTLIKIVEDQGIILQSQDYESNPLTNGQKINADIKFGGDEWFHGYFGTISKQ